MRLPTVRRLLLPMASLMAANGLATHVSLAASPRLASKSPSQAQTQTQKPYIDYMKSGREIGTFPTLLAAEKGLDEYPGGTVKDRLGHLLYQQLDFTNVDLRFSAPKNVTAASINRFLTQHNSPLAGLGSAFMAGQRLYGVNANYLVSHAIEESNWGKSPIALARDNLYGTGAYDANPRLAGSFPSFDYAIRYQAWVVRKDYLTPGFSHSAAPTLDGMGQNYASDPQWANNIRAVMNQLAVYLGDTVRSYHQYAAGATAPNPPVTAEPAYALAGAIGTTKIDRDYGAVPVYQSVGEGQLSMFSRPLKLGDSGDDVTTLQTALNEQANAGLTVDGTFGETTEVAVKQFQTDRGLPDTGICDYELWTKELGIAPSVTVPTNERLSIDEVLQGMLGGDVTEWYHIRGKGFVSAADVALTNTVRVQSRHPQRPSQVMIPVYGMGKNANIIAWLHSGDMVVSRAPNGTHNRAVIHLANQSTGQSNVGWVDLTKVRLVAVE